MLAEQGSPMAGPAEHSNTIRPDSAEGRRAGLQPACSDGSGAMVELFYSEEIADIARAKKICTACPVRVPCLEGAAERREPYGVWGGHLFFRGRVLAFKRPRGRPPKNAQAPMIA